MAASRHTLRDCCKSTEVFSHSIIHLCQPQSMGFNRASMLFSYPWELLKICGILHGVMNTPECSVNTTYANVTSVTKPNSIIDWTVCFTYSHFSLFKHDLNINTDWRLFLCVFLADIAISTGSLVRSNSTDNLKDTPNLSSIHHRKSKIYHSASTSQSDQKRKRKNRL